MKTALLFPGQGSQTIGMGKALASEFPVARRTFEEADEALGYALSTVCFEGPAERLTLTATTQPAILTTSIAAWRVWAAETGVTAAVAAGHSLGEFSALVAAGALDFVDAVRLVRLRGNAMQEAVAAGQGGMAALMGVDAAGAAALCEAVRGELACAPANLNGGGQIVISGHLDAIDAAVARAKEFGVKRAVKLAVSAPFHCSLMQPAAVALAAALESIDVRPLEFPVVANVDAQPNQDAARVKGLLVEQVTHPVRWEESVQTLERLGVGRAYELGAGQVLRGLVRRIAPAIAVHCVAEPEHVRASEES